MTLAELFLLMLIVAWYGSKLESEPLGPGDPVAELRIELAQARTQLAETRAELQVVKSENAELTAILTWIGAQLGYSGDPRSLDSWNVKLPAIIQGLKRGKPICATPNVLIAVHIDGERQQVTLKTPFKPFAIGRLPDKDIDTFLLAVSRFSEREKCAFDYSLEWRTDTDFRVAKKRFEQYFYPAGDWQIK